MAAPNQLTALLPNRALQEVLLRALGGVVTPGLPDSVLVEQIHAQMSAVELLSFHMLRSPDAYVLTLLTGWSLLRVEVFPSGGYMIRTVPTSRIRQMSELRDRGGDGLIIAEIVIEFDAGTFETFTTDDGLQVTRPGGWVLVPERTPDGLIPPSASDQMTVFAAQLRHLLSTRQT